MIREQIPLRKDDTNHEESDIETWLTTKIMLGKGVHSYKKGDVQIFGIVVHWHPGIVNLTERRMIVRLCLREGMIATYAQQ